jgi:hypothetical protein
VSGQADPILIASGALLIAAACSWRAMSRRQAIHAVRSALADRDPAVRRAGVAVAAQQGLSVHSGTLLELARLETDRSVSLALARAVVRNQWEPATAPHLIGLRLWAQRLLDEAVKSDQAEHIGGTPGPPSARAGTPSGDGDVPTPLRSSDITARLDRAIHDLFGRHRIGAEARPRVGSPGRR